MKIGVQSQFVKNGMEHLGIEEIAPRKDGESDYEYIKAVLDAHDIGFVERQGDSNESFLVLYNGEPTLEMRAARKTSVDAVSVHCLPSFGLTAFEFYAGVLQSF